MPLARAYTVALIGTDGHLVEVEAHIADGLPATVLVGLPDTALREARDRIRAAILNSGRDWPKRKITIGLSPATLPKRGSAFDVAIAAALLAADEVFPLPALKGITFFAELGLDGRLRPVPGVFPAVAAAAAGGMTTAVVAAENEAEARLVPGVRVAAFRDLASVIRWLRQPPPPPGPSNRGPDPDPSPPASDGRGEDMSDIVGQPAALVAAEVAAAGEHNLSLLGPAAAGKTMLAERIPTILPDLDQEAALAVTAIHSVAGRLGAGAALISRPPFCAPHHTSSMAAMVGGGSGLIRPGALALAHRGVLFLDDAPDFPRDVLDSLRQPLETGEVILARRGVCATFPARFLLVLAARPCPCWPSTGTCGCSRAVRARYLGRLSGPLMDKVDIRVTLDPVEPTGLRNARTPADTSAAMRERVTLARQRAADRLAGTPWRVNAEVPGSELHRAYVPEPGALRQLDHVLETGQISSRGINHVIRVAWTIADLAGKDRPGADEVECAIRLRQGGEPVIALPC